jgi:endonuclease/exonuclease/phosphatase family metal-dependent hydrolase
VRFLTYNIRHAEGYDGWVSPARIAGIVRRSSAVVVGLNEVWRIPPLYDQSALLGGLVPMQSAYQANGSYLALSQGNAVLTSGSILTQHDLQLPRGIERRGALVCELDVDGARIAFATTHLSLGRQQRAKQIDALVRELPRDLPLVLTGDFNCRAEELAPLEEFLTVPAEHPATFPAARPVKSLDYIAFSAHWRLLEQGTIPSLASDHRPLWAELELKTR